MYGLRHLPKHSVFLDVVYACSIQWEFSSDHNLQLCLLTLPFTSKVASKKTMLNRKLGSSSILCIISLQNSFRRSKSSSFSSCTKWILYGKFNSFQNSQHIRLVSCCAELLYGWIFDLQQRIVQHPIFLFNGHRQWLSWTIFHTPNFWDRIFITKYIVEKLPYFCCITIVIFIDHPIPVREKFFFQRYVIITETNNN